MGRSLKLVTMGVFVGLLSACNSTSELDMGLKDAVAPANWQHVDENLTVSDNWLSSISGNNQLQQWVNKALSDNHQLRQQALAVEIKKQQLIASGANLWPSLDLTLSNSRRKAGIISDSKSLSLDLSFQADIWGKLSDGERQANLNYLAEQASFNQAKQQLVANVVTAWYGVIEAQKLLALYQRRAENSKQNLEIIEMGYRQGLGKALDVYLTRNSLNNELSRVAQQQDTLKKNKRQLERLLGDYPKAALNIEAELPLLQSDIPLGVPSELVSRKPALVSAWYSLLAQDAGLAYAHKQRFPSLNLRASLSKSGTSFSDVVSGATGWSLINSLAGSVFDAGKLKANEEQARLTLQRGEQSYLDTLYTAFLDVENGISSEGALKQRYKVMLEAEKNAIAAQTLSFEQYQSGLVSYTTVLDAQTRAYDAQSTVIQLKNQLLANRIKLHIALGGDFATGNNTIKGAQ